MSRRIAAVCGKGGVGKTTFAALLARAIHKRPDVRALFVDADHAAGLAMALGIEVDRTLNDIRKQTIQEIRAGESDNRDLAAGIDYRLMDILVETDNLAFFALGRPEEEGCYCSVHNLLREAIALLARSFDLTVIDAEAGIEQINRRVMRAVDTLVLVSDISAKGLRVAKTIRDVAQKTAATDFSSGLVVSRARDENEARAAAAACDLPLLGWIPEDDTVRQFDAAERSFLKIPACPAGEAVERVAAALGLL